MIAAESADLAFINQGVEGHGCAPHRDPHPDGRQTIASSTQRGGLMRVLAFEEGTGCDSKPQATSPSKILPNKAVVRPQAARGLGWPV